MNTYFASPERLSDNALQIEIEYISNNPFINGLMNVVGGLLAVLNEHRQILTVNQHLLDALGVSDARNVLGLRPGEALHCEHASAEPAGCGTTRFCSTCGAAIAIVASLAQDKPVEKLCALTITRNGKPIDLYFNVQSCPVTFNDKRLLLLFLQDITMQQQWAMLERVFFHDVNNLITGLLGSSQFLLQQAETPQTSEMARDIHQMVVRLAQEFKIQQHLTNSELHNYRCIIESVTLTAVFSALRQTFSKHPSMTNKILMLPEEIPNLTLKTDSTLLLRVLGNMVINALEAGSPGDVVRVYLEQTDTQLIFNVQNRQVIPPAVATRIFQRNFSTKAQFGRGLGTYSMKLFGETFLGGKVDFSTGNDTGTIFTFTING